METPRGGVSGQHCAEPEQGRGESRGELARAEEHSAETHGPIDQRRFLKVGDRVQPRRHPVPRGEHLARDAGVAALVWVGQRQAAEEKEAAKAEEEAAKAEEANDEWARSSGNLYMISTPMERARSKREREKERALDKAANKREKQYEDENRRHREIMNRIESESKKRVKEIKAEFKKSLQDDWNRIQNAEEAAKAEEKANK